TQPRAHASCRSFPTRRSSDLGSSRPALVIFTSDNGAPTCYPEDGALEDLLPNGELRGQKADVYDGGHRVPLIVSGDGLAPGVDRSEEHTSELQSRFDIVCRLL